MLLKILDILECPSCNEAARLWKMNGDVTETRITNGEVICPKDHSWIVKEEILRFDKENADEPMQFNDHPRTGFPDQVGEQERFEFLDTLEELVQNIDFNEQITYKITGKPILFMKFLPDSSSNFIFVYNDEGTLRQLQEMAVRKRIYDQVAFVRATDIGYIGQVKDISVFEERQKADLIIRLEGNPSDETIWQGKNVGLVFYSE